jgi:Phage stabilisation protein
MPELPGFCGPTGTVRSPNAACDRLLNMYIENVESDRKRYTLYSMPGLRQVALLPSGPVRGLFEATNGRVFAVTSTTLFEVFAGWTFVSRGSVHTGTTPASFTDDGIHMVCSVDGVGYGYDFASNVLTTLPTTGPQTFGQFGYIDGRIVVNEPGTRRFWYTPILDALTWPALNFYSAEARPDLLVTLLVDHREIWLFGSQSIEVWFSTGNSLDPFSRMQNVFIEQGIETPYAVDALDNTVFWLGGSIRGEGPVWTVNGYQPVRVSTHALESAMAGMATVGDAVMATARHGGHAWVVLDYPSGGETWAYDTATQSWAEWPRLLDDGSFGTYLSNTHCSAFGEHLWGDRTTGDLYIWDIEYHLYGMAPRLCRRTSPHVRSEQKRLRYSQFRVECEAGVGLDGAPPVGVDPQMLLRTSIDGGHSWSFGRWRSMGRLGARRQQACWYSLGQAREMAFEVTVTDPVKVALLAAYLEVS